MSLFICACIVFIVSMDFTRNLLGSYNETFTVQKNDAARECREHRSTFRRKFKSESTNQSFGHYCGLIFTDRGWYLLPQTGRDYFLNDSRPEMDKILEPGCRVTAKIIGRGDPYHPNKKQRVPVRKHISKILVVHGCESPK